MSSATAAQDWARRRANGNGHRDYVISTAADVAKPLPPLDWLCEGLRVARGACTVAAGYGYSRKTLYAQSLALSIATGSAAFDVFSVTHANVLHIDFEQGERITNERYQRLARYMNIELETAKLYVVTFPNFHLTSGNATDIIRRLLDEAKPGFVIVDSLRASMSGVDENSSEVREHIDMFTRELKRVNAAGHIIHHARKPGDGKTADRYSLRGSGAIYDAFDGVFVFSGEKGEPTRVSHEKDRLIGSELDSFCLESSDVARGQELRWGLKVSWIGDEQASGAADDRKAREQADLDVARQNAVRDYMRKLPGRRFVGRKTELANQFHGRQQVVLATISHLVSIGHIKEDIRKSTSVYTLDSNV